ncbi:MAG TPA: DUF6282 family protein [Thermodesulfobacteriota bacterium]|nr:DUF6282 family protein [Thermodesulfobacteriota bacterium]
MICEADQLLEGAIDLHCHGYPEISPEAKMRVEDLEAARLAAQAKMKGFVLKSHMWPTVGRVYHMRNAVEGITIWPSLTINTSSGGFSPWVVESAFQQGAKVLWMPTWSARNDIQRGGFSRIMKGWLKTMDGMTPEDGLTVLDREGRVERRVKEVLALAKEFDVPVFTGHLSPDESLALAREAKGMGLKKFVFGHPDSHSIGATMEHIKAMAEMNYFIEFTFLGLMPAFHRIGIREIAGRIREVGAARSVLTTDFFFEWAAPPSEMLRMFIGALLFHGISAEEIDLMARKNPAYLLGV